MTLGEKIKEARKQCGLTGATCRQDGDFEVCHCKMGIKQRGLPDVDNLSIGQTPERQCRLSP